MMPASLVLAEGLNPLGHVTDISIPGFGPFTMNVLTMFLAALLTGALMHIAAKAIRTGDESLGNERYVTKGRFAQVIEVMVLYLRNTLIKPQLGRDANKFTPLLLSIFFFILTCNLIGLVPLLDLQHLIGGVAMNDAHWAVIGGTPTGRLWLTAALATVVFIAWNVHGIQSNGIGGWLHHLTAGAPVGIWPIIVPVEMMGMIVKPAALAIRLFANMTAGHVLLAVILGFSGLALAGLGIFAGGGITVISMIAGFAIFLLEIFVALLQAFIFMFLTTLFIAQMSHHEHDDHAHAEKYDAKHPAIADPAVPVTA